MPQWHKQPESSSRKRGNCHSYWKEATPIETTYCMGVVICKEKRKAMQSKYLTPKDIYLSVKKDADLVALFYVKEFHFAEKMKEAITAYVKGNPIKIQLPKELPQYPDYLPIIERVSIRFSDKEVMEFLHKIKAGSANDCLRTIFRSSLDGPYIVPYLNESGFQAIYETENGEKKKKGYRLISNKEDKKETTQKRQSRKQQERNPSKKQKPQKEESKELRDEKSSFPTPKQKKWKKKKPQKTLDEFKEIEETIQKESKSETTWQTESSFNDADSFETHNPFNFSW